MKPCSVSQPTDVKRYLDKGIEYPLLPVGIVVLESGGLPRVGGGYQPLHLDQQGPDGLVLAGQRLEDVAAVALLELKVLLYRGNGIKGTWQTPCFAIGAFQTTPPPLNLLPAS